MGARSAVRVQLDPEIERLLYIHNAVQSLVVEANTLLDAAAFPKSSRAAAVLAQDFKTELEANLLHVWGDAGD